MMPTTAVMAQIVVATKVTSRRDRHAYVYCVCEVRRLEIISSFLSSWCMLCLWK